jgi:hypothetical protein
MITNTSSRSIAFDATPHEKEAARGRRQRPGARLEARRRPRAPARRVGGGEPREGLGRRERAQRPQPPQPLRPRGADGAGELVERAPRSARLEAADDEHSHKRA